MALARHAELSENRRSLQRRNRPQILHPRRPRRRRPSRRRPRRDATSIPASGLPPITPAGVSGRALGPTCPARCQGPRDRPEPSPQRCRARSPFRGQARRHRRALVQTGPPNQRLRFRLLTRKVCLPRRRVCHHTGGSRRDKERDPRRQ